jgi:hypothetical protein
MHDNTPTFYFFCFHDSTHNTHTLLFFCFSTLYMYPQHTSIIHSHSTRSALSKQVRFISQHKHIIFLVLFYIYIYIYYYRFCYVHIHIYTYNKSCLTFLHLNIYLPIYISCHSSTFRKLTRFCLDEISAALISFCCCQPNPKVTSNHIKKKDK